MDGFKRPNQAPSAPPQQGRVAQGGTPAVPAQMLPEASVVDILNLEDPVPGTPPVASKPVKKRKAWKIIGLILVIVLVITGATAVLAYNWYNQQLSPADNNDTSDQQVQVGKDATLAYIAEKLQERGIIRNKLAFQVYAQVSGQASSIKQGTCVVHKSQSTQEILATLTKGCNEFKVVTFYPGGTIEKPLYKPDFATLSQTMYVKYALTKAGFSDSEISKALSATYTGPLFEGRPAGTTLEGYIFGETYHVAPGATAETVLQTAFDEMYKQINSNGLQGKFKAQGLNMYQAITLASIVQRELNCEDKPTSERKDRCYQYQRTIAQVFLKRLQEGDMLGSDVTFIYAADMLGVTPTVNMDSPYNTRVYTGLPPGPVATPGILALKSVGNPTDTNYHYFVAGDDGLIYFSKTLAEHEANIDKHCKILCNDL